MAKYQLQIINPKTGEQKQIIHASDMEISEYLTEVAFQLKKLKAEKENIEKYIKQVRLKLDEDNKMIFGKHKISKSEYLMFDKDTFLARSTEEEKAIYQKWIDIQSKYQKQIERITFI